MDLATIIGAVIAYVNVIYALIIGAGISVYIDIPSVLIVFGGIIGVLMMCFPMGTVVATVKIGMKTIVVKGTPPEKMVATLVEFAVKARRDGILSLESAEGEIDDAFLKKGIRLAVDGTEPDIIREILETDLAYMEERHKEGAAIFTAIGDYGPAMGMIGTLIGLVAMLQSMSDPTSIGPAMAVALITTFYGSILANMVGLPLATKLKGYSGGEKMLREIMIAGIMAIQAGDNPRIVEQKLNAFLPPNQRKSQFD